MNRGCGEGCGTEKQSRDGVDELAVLGTGDSLALAFPVRACISPFAGQRTGGESLPFWATGAYSAVSGQLGVPA